jgi:fatty-acyl-CoA synthase
MSDRSEFTQQLRRRIGSQGDRILLRIATSPGAAGPIEFSGRQILNEGAELSARYAIPRRAGVVLLLLPHSPELFLLQIGLVLRGYWPAILPWPTSRIDPEKYQRNLLHQLRELPADQLITLPRLAQNLAPGLAYPVTACPIENAAHFERAFSYSFTPGLPGKHALERTDPGPDALFLQFSGGTTGVQKSVVVTAPMLTAQLARLAEALRFSGDDVVVSWLPMYHDMGLIACLWFPLWHGAASVQIAASDWLLKPALLFEWIERYRGSFTWLPNFAFSYLSQQREEMTGRYSLGHVRAWINCSEPVRLRSMMSFTDQFRDWGVLPESLQSSYAMAETVFAVTQSKLGEVLVTTPRNGLHPDLSFALVDQVFVSSGRPLDGTQVRIVGPSGSVCKDGEPGEIQIHSPSLFQGYWGSQGFRTNSLVPGGWHATGDYGFTRDNELFVIGRLKDIVIVGGQNIFPEDVEAVAGSVDGVYPGRVVAFGIEDQQYGTESLAVIAEMTSEYHPETAAALEREIRKVILAAVGIAPRHVAVVPKRWIVKSTAGKISRRDTRERFLHETLVATL